MLRCSHTAAAVCPYRKYCEPDAVYVEGSECDRFNEAVNRTINAEDMASLSDWLDKHPEALTMWQVRRMCDCSQCTREHDSPTECGCGRCTGT